MGRVVSENKKEILNFSVPLAELAVMILDDFIIAIPEPPKFQSMHPSLRATAEEMKSPF